MIIKTTHSVFMTYILGFWNYVQIVNYSVFMTIDSDLQEYILDIWQYDF